MQSKKNSLKTNILLRIMILLLISKLIVFFYSYKYLLTQLEGKAIMLIFLKILQSESLIVGIVLLFIYFLKNFSKTLVQIILFIPLGVLYLLYFLDILALAIYQQRFSLDAIKGFITNFDHVVLVYLLGIVIIGIIILGVGIGLARLIKFCTHKHGILLGGVIALIIYLLPIREIDFGILPISGKNILSTLSNPKSPLLIETTTSNFAPPPREKLDLPEKKLYMLDTAYEYRKDTAQKEPAYVFKNFTTFANLTNVYGENYAKEVLILATQKKPELAFSYLDVYKKWKDPNGSEIVQDVLSTAVQKNPDLAFEHLSKYEQLSQNGKKIAKIILQRASLAYENKLNYEDFFHQEIGRKNRSNVILVFFESASVVDSQKFGGITDRLPKIDKIADQGTSFLNFYSNGSASDMGHIATLLGQDPLLYEADGMSYMSYRFDQDPLARFFNNLGYQTTFISTASLDFLNQRRFIQNIGYQQIIDEKAFKGQRVYTFNAAPDTNLYQKTLEVVDQQTKPYFITIQTISSHTPYSTPYGNTESKMLEYINDSFDIFYQGLLKRNFFDNGILLVISDHRKITPLSDAEFQKRGLAASSKIVGFMLGKGIEAKEDNNFYQQKDIFYSLKKEFGSGNVEVFKQFNDIFEAHINRNRGLKRFLNEDKVQVLGPEGYLGYLDLKEKKVLEGYANMPSTTILEYVEQFLNYQANKTIIQGKKSDKKETISSKIIAHRGDMSSASENSLIAFNHAAQKGADGTEIDITMTKDGHVVVFHGHKVYNNTQCKREYRSVCEMTLEELKSCKLNDGQEIMTLEEMLPEIKSLFDIYFFDLKIQDEEICGEVNNDLFNKTLASVIKHNLKNKSVFSSYDQKISNALYAITTVPTGLDTFSLEAKNQLIGSEFDYFITVSDNISADLVRELHDQDRKVVAYTVNTPKEFLRLNSIGVDYIMTDEIIMMKNLIESLE